MPILPVGTGDNLPYQQILSMAIEDRSSSYQDLVSDNNALLAVMRDKGLWQTYSGPRIRQTLQISKQVAQWYNGYDVLLNPAIDLFADAWYEPKMVVVPIILSKQEILNNQGEAQLMDVLDSYMAAAERALEDAMDSALHAAGGGKQLTGLQTAIPTANTTGVYGGIDRAQNTWWQTQYFNVQTYMAGVTQVTSTTVRPLINRVMTAQSRAKDYADLLLMSPQHYEAYDAATIAIQRQTSGSLGKLGFSTLEYIGGGKRATIVLEGGIGSDMPADTTYGLHTDSLRLRYHPSRNFDSIFKGEGQMPIDKDAVAQFIGWMGELTMTNPKFNWKLYDPTPGSLMATTATDDPAKQRSLAHDTTAAQRAEVAREKAER